MITLVCSVRLEWMKLCHVLFVISASNVGSYWDFMGSFSEYYWNGHLITARRIFGSSIFREVSMLACWCIWLHRNSIVFYRGDLSFARWKRHLRVTSAVPLLEPLRLREKRTPAKPQPQSLALFTLYFPPSGSSYGWRRESILGRWTVSGYTTWKPQICHAVFVTGP
jgi:hypothetical protein